MKDIAYSFIGTTIVYSIYVQLSVGNIWYRSSVDGDKSFQLQSLLSLMANPFHSTTLWNPNMLDINYIVFTGVGMATSLFLNSIIQQ